MKLTWFGETAIRVHVGGRIFVFDAGRAPANVDPVELLSASDESHSLAHNELPGIDLANWRPRRARSALDQEGQDEGVHAYGIGLGIVLIEALGEPPLVLLSGEAPDFGRWADGAVFVLFGNAEAIIETARSLLASSRPRLIALGAGHGEAETAVSVLRPLLDGTSLVALEPGFALEA